MGGSGWGRGGGMTGWKRRDERRGGGGRVVNDGRNDREAYKGTVHGNNAKNETCLSCAEHCGLGWYSKPKKHPTKCLLVQIWRAHNVRNTTEQCLG